MQLVVHDNYDYRIAVEIRSIYSNSLIVEMEFQFSMLTYKSYSITMLSEHAAAVVTDPLLEPAREILRKFGEEDMDMNTFSVWLHANKDTLVVHRPTTS